MPHDRHRARQNPLPDAVAQSVAFRQTRHARRTALVEDYLELIADFGDAGLPARQTDIATRLGVAQPTVAKVLARLSAEGFIVRNRSRGVLLTATGRATARESRERHRIVETFLRSLGISADTARIDAEGIEHHVSAETLAAFRRVIETQTA